MNTEEIKQLKEILTEGTTSVQIDPVLTQIRDLLLQQSKKHWTDYISSFSAFLLVTVTVMGFGAKAYLSLKSDLESVVYTQNTIKRDLSVQADAIDNCKRKHEILDKFLIEYNFKEKLNQGGN